MVAYKPRPPGSLKRASTEFVALCGGPAAVADLIGVAETTVFKYSDDSWEHEGRFFNLHQVRLLERHCGRPAMTEFMAGEQGCVVLRPAGAAPKGWGQAIAGVSDRHTRIIMHLATSLDDDARIDSREAGEGIDRIDEAVALLMGVRARLAGIRDSEDR